MKKVFIHSMQGLGDNIMQRAVLKEYLAENDVVVYLNTPYPELYSDLNIKTVRPESKLRCQSKHMQQAAFDHDSLPEIAFDQIFRVKYTGWIDRGFSLMEGMAMCLGMDKFFFELDLPQKLMHSEPVLKAVFVKPPTIRTDWSAPARNCKMDYIQYAMHKIPHCTVLTDMEKGKEEYDDFRPLCRHYMEKGLTLQQLVQLVKGAEGFIASPGFFIPLAAALKKPILIIYGGNGAYNQPSNMPENKKAVHVVPENQCMCKDPRHKRS